VPPSDYRRRMARDASSDHAELAARLRDRVLTSGALDPTLRAQALERGVAGTRMPEPYRALALQVGDASSRVTDAQVAAVRDALGSDVETFELVLSAAIGAGLRRWTAAGRAIEKARGATP